MPYEPKVSTYEKEWLQQVLYNSSLLKAKQKIQGELSITITRQSILCSIPKIYNKESHETYDAIISVIDTDAMDHEMNIKSQGAHLTS